MEFYFEVSKAIEGGLLGDPEQVRAYADKLAQKLKSVDDKQAGNGIEKLLEASTASGSGKIITHKSSSVQRKHIVMEEAKGSKFQRPVPVERENRFSLADKLAISKGSVKLFVQKEQEEIMNLLIKTVEKKDKLLAFNLPVNPTLLLYGKPGTGKSKMAALIASQLGLPLITARSDALISSYLGSTAKNIRSLLEYAQKEPCVLFLDEFDAIAKARDDKNEVGELKRVVVSLLQNIDNLGDTVLIAATNHQHLLDPAIWRRFHYKMELTAPDESVRERLFEELLGMICLDKKYIKTLVSFTSGLTGAEIEMSIHSYLRQIVLNDSDFDIFGLLRELLKHKYAWIKFNLPERNESIVKLRTEDTALFTHKVLGSIFGMSESNVRKILKGAEQ